MSQNKLQELPPKVFYKFRFTMLGYLRSLRLEGNQLRSLGDRPFYGLDYLEELNLQQNQLTDLDEDVFGDDFYRSLKRSLLDLKLGGNRLTTLPGGLFNGFTNLLKLQLQSNQLVRLPPKLFQTLRA
jgi:Leucine-rich repeat (LRR) protein